MTDQHHDAEITKSSRGFSGYGGTTDEKGMRLSVQESSEVGRPRIHLYIGDQYEVCPYLNAEQALELAKALLRFVRDATDDENWRNDPQYREVWVADEMNEEM